MHVHVRGERENGREENGRKRGRDRDAKGEGSVKSIRSTLVKVYILVRHGHKAIHTTVVFNLY